MDAYKINDYERDTIVPLVCRMLKLSSLPLPSKVIAESIRNEGCKVNTRQVRLVINFIRREGIIPCVASSPKGFFVAANVLEMNECINTLSALADSIQEVIEALKQQRYIKFNY